MDLLPKTSEQTGLAERCTDKWGQSGAKHLEFLTSTDTCCNIFTLLTWGPCLLNPLYPPVLRPWVQEQTHRGMQLFTERVDVSMCVQKKKKAQKPALYLLLIVCLRLQPAVEIILFIHPLVAWRCAIDSFICHFCLFVWVLFSSPKVLLYIYT